MIKIPIKEKVFVQSIGYATLLQCPNKQSITIVDSSVSFKDDPFDALQTIFEPCQPPIKQQPFEDIKLSLVPTNYFVYTNTSKIKNSVTFKVKIFFDKRQITKITIPINTTVEVLKKKIFQRLQKNPNMFHKTRLFYSMIDLIQLQDFKYIWQYNIPNNGKLVMTTTQSFAFDPPKVSLIKIKNQTLQKAGDQAYSTLVGNVGWQKCGKYYWQIRIDKCQSQEDIFIGIAYKNIDITCCPTHCKFWGILPLFAKKFSPAKVGNLENYGAHFKIGESVGVLVSFSNKSASISFYRNGVSLGVAYQGIYGIIYPAVTLFGSNNNIVEVSYDPRAPMPFSN